MSDLIIRLQYDAFIYTLIQTIIIYFVLLLYTRMLGKKQMSQLTFFNYITGLALGSLTANSIFQDTFSFLQELIIIGVWCLLSVITGLLSMKSSSMKLIFGGEPTVLIKKGKIIKKSLKRSRLTVDNLRMMLREQKVFSMKDVDYAILETNGKVTVLKKLENQSVTKKDMNLNPGIPLNMPTEVIFEGRLIQSNLKELDLTENEIIDEIHKQGYLLENIVYAEMLSDGNLYIDGDK